MPLCDEARDLCLLWGELAEGIQGAFPGVFSRRPKFDAGPFGERLHTGVREEVVRDPKLFACIEPTAVTTQPLPVEQARAGEIHPQARRFETVDGLTVQLLGGVPFGQNRA